MTSETLVGYTHQGQAQLQAGVKSSVCCLLQHSDSGRDTGCHSLTIRRFPHDWSKLRKVENAIYELGNLDRPTEESCGSLKPQRGQLRELLDQVKGCLHLF